MELSPTNVITYLLSRGVLTPRELLAGDLVVHRASRRNRNLRVTRAGGSGFFVKQAQLDDAIPTLRREALCYRRTFHERRLEPLRPLLPKFVDYDPTDNVLVLELLPASETLNQLFLREHAFTPALGELLADALAIVHSDAGRRCRSETDDTTFPAQLPWLLPAIEAPGSLARWLGPNAAMLLTGLTSDPAVVNAARRVTSTWRRDTLIHGDLKWDNCLVVHSSEGAPSLRIIDWELADIGDGRWDIGGVIGALVASWAGFSAWATEVDGERIEVDAVRPAIQRFWRRLLERLAVPLEERETLLDQAITCAGLRMIQTALELTPHQPSIPYTAYAVAEQGRALLRDPQRARTLLGLREVPAR